MIKLPTSVIIGAFVGATLAAIVSIINIIFAGTP